MTELSQPRRHTLLAIDMERYSARSNVDQYQAQRVFRETLDEAARLIGLDRSAWRTQPSGDGELAILPDGVSEPGIVAGLAPTVDRLLRAKNASLVPTARVRMRIAIHNGLVHLDGANGYPGEAVVTVCRLVDAQPLRQALAAFPGAGAALIVSDAIYQDVVRHRYAHLRPERFRSVEVRLPAKQFDAVAWIAVPDEDVATVELGDPAAPAVAQPAEPGRSTYSFGTTTFNGPAAIGDGSRAWSVDGGRPGGAA